MAIAFDANLGTVTNTASLTTSAAAAAGSRIVLAVGWNDPTNNLNATFSSAGLSWVTDKQYRAAYQQCCGIISADAPSGLASSTVITPSFDGAIDFGPGICAASFTGLEGGASGYLDTTSTAKDDFEEAWSTNNLVTTAADCLLFACSQVEPSSGNTASGSTTEIHDFVVEGTNRMTTGYRIVASAATYTLTGTWAGSASYQQNIGAAYKAASGVVVPAPTLFTVRSGVVTR